MQKKTVYSKSVLIAKLCQLSVAYLVAILMTYITASLFQSLSVLAGLQKAGAEISANWWIHTLWYDLKNLAFGGKYVSYGVTVIIGFAIAMSTATLVRKLSGLSGILVYPLAGATAMATQLYIINTNFFDLTLFSGTRGLTGFILQLLAGALGGAVFAWVSKQRS